jgi:hypothetical protein
MYHFLSVKCEVHVVAQLRNWTLKKKQTNKISAVPISVHIGRVSNMLEKIRTFTIAPKLHFLLQFMSIRIQT